MARRISFATLVFLVVVTGGALLERAAAATYVTGDSLGWTIPPGGATVYSNWSSQHSFTVGDILVFNFITGQHDLARVTKEAFDACNSTGPISLQTVGPANFTLNSTGEYYFICTFGQHCVSGQKLAVNVTSTSGGPTASPPASPPTSPSPTPTPPPAGTVTPPPPPPASPSLAPSPSTPPGTTGPPPPPTATSPPSSSPPPGSSTSPPSGSTLSPPPPPPPSTSPPKAVATSAVIFMSIAIGILC